MQIIDLSKEQLLSRRAVARRWGVSTATIKRREHAGALIAIRFNNRLVRYRLADVERCEREAMNTNAPAGVASA